MLLNFLGRRKWSPLVPSRARTRPPPATPSTTGQALTQYALMSVLVSGVMVPILQYMASLFMIFCVEIILATAGG